MSKVTAITIVELVGDYLMETTVKMWYWGESCRRRHPNLPPPYRSADKPHCCLASPFLPSRTEVESGVGTLLLSNIHGAGLSRNTRRAIR